MSETDFEEIASFLRTSATNSTCSDSSRTSPDPSISLNNTTNINQQIKIHKNLPTFDQPTYNTPTTHTLYFGALDQKLTREFIWNICSGKEKNLTQIMHNGRSLRLIQLYRVVA